MLSFLSPKRIAWCAQVIKAPEVTKTKVFNKGIFQGFIPTIPLGGQIEPISNVGFKAE